MGINCLHRRSRHEPIPKHLSAVFQCQNAIFSSELFRLIYTVYHIFVSFISSFPLYPFSHIQITRLQPSIAKKHINALKEWWKYKNRLIDKRKYNLTSIYHTIKLSVQKKTFGCCIEMNESAMVVRDIFHRSSHAMAYFFFVFVFAPYYVCVFKMNFQPMEFHCCDCDNAIGCALVAYFPRWNREFCVASFACAVYVWSKFSALLWPQWTKGHRLVFDVDYFESIRKIHGPRLPRQLA